VPPLVIGLTGGIAAGKSEALAAFKHLGAATISSDALVHELLGGAEMRERLSARWGEEVAPGGEVDRARVGEIVFGDPKELAWLESELHPLVGVRIAAWLTALPPETQTAVVEVPLLFEAGMQDVFAATVAVTASDDRRRERAGLRDQVMLEEREGRQLSQEEKASRADHVIDNDGSVAELRAAVGALLSRLHT